MSDMTITVTTEVDDKILALRLKHIDDKYIAALSIDEETVEVDYYGVSIEASTTSVENFTESTSAQHDMREYIAFALKIHEKQATAILEKFVVDIKKEQKINDWCDDRAPFETSLEAEPGTESVVEPQVRGTSSLASSKQPKMIKDNEKVKAINDKVAEKKAKADSNHDSEVTLTVKEIKAKDGKIEKAVEVQTSNKSVRFLLKYAHEKWTTQINYNLNYIYPINSSKVPIFEENSARETKLFKLFAEKTKIEAREAKRLLSELIDVSGKHTDEIMSLMEESVVSNPTLEELYPAEIIKRAYEILKTGDPFKFLLDRWKKDYAVMEKKVTNGNNTQDIIVDDSIGAMTFCVVGSTLISNSKGLHQKIGGDSGHGKSYALECAFNLFPPEKACTSSMSAKALFYNPLPAGTVVYCDDFDLNNTDVYTTIKQCTSSYQSETKHMTVVNGASLNCTIAPRMGIILSSVDNFDDIQMDSRFGETEVNNTVEMQNAIHKKQAEKEWNKTKAGSVDEEALICRCTWSILESQGLYEIRIPYSHAIVWTDIKHPRSFPFFTDIIRVMCLFKMMQREKVGDYYIATIEDFNNSLAMYNKMEKTNATKLRNKKNIIPSISVTDIVFDDYLGNGIIELFPK